jgi:hypothetical protein
MFGNECVLVTDIIKDKTNSNEKEITIHMKLSNSYSLEFLYDLKKDKEKLVVDELEGSLELNVQNKEDVIKGLSLLSRPNRIQKVSYDLKK